MNTNAVIAGELDRAQHQHLRSRRRHLEHLLVRDRRQLARVRHEPRVGGEDAGHVGVDLAGRAERCRERDGRRVGAAAAERRDLHRVAREALEPGDEHDLVLIERVPDPVAADLADLRLAVRRVGEDAGLRARQRDGLLPEIVDRHRDERAGDALARREEHVELAHVRRRRDLVGEIDQPVGRLAHRRDGADDAQAALLRVDEPSRDVPDLVRVGDRRAAELHDDGVEVHGGRLPGSPARTDGDRRGARFSRRLVRPSGPGRTIALMEPDPSGPANVVHCNVEHGLHLERDKVEALLDGGDFFWLDIHEPTKADLEILREEFGFHPLSLEDSWRFDQRPKIDDYDGYVFLVVFGASGDGRRRRSRRGALLLLRPLPDHAASRRRAVADRAPRALRQARRAGRRSGAAAPRGRRRPRRQLLPRLSAIDDRIDVLEDSIFRKADDAQLQEIFSMKRSPREHAEGDLPACATSSRRS